MCVFVVGGPHQFYGHSQISKETTTVVLLAVDIGVSCFSLCMSCWLLVGWVAGGQFSCVQRCIVPSTTNTL